MPETPYDTPGGDRVWVIDTPTAAHNLATMLERFRNGDSEPLIFGDSGAPEGVVISWQEWTRLEALRADADGFEHAYEVTRQRLADPRPSVPYEDVAKEFGWDDTDGPDKSST
jgi:PHD/YefM family antitoxin component YafN of YafNO toxin-antitoxin module